VGAAGWLGWRAAARARGRPRLRQAFAAINVFALTTTALINSRPSMACGFFVDTKWICFHRMITAAGAESLR